MSTDEIKAGDEIVVTGGTWKGRSGTVLLVKYGIAHLETGIGALLNRVRKLNAVERLARLGESDKP